MIPRLPAVDFLACAISLFPAFRSVRVASRRGDRMEGMMRRRILSALLAATVSSLVCGSAVQAQGKGKPAPPPANVNVTSNVTDADPVSLYLLRSDGLGTYATADNVVSQIYGSSGDWRSICRVRRSG